MKKNLDKFEGSNDVELRLMLFIWSLGADGKGKEGSN